LSTEFITIKGAREHNLKNINLKIPKNKLIVFTGISGSGKSSLAFDTIYAEGQRRYVESLSSYARQFLGVMDKPDVDMIDGLSPAISIDQKSAGHNPRSTVGTITEIYDYLRLLFARAGHPHCPNCGRPVKSQTVQEITDSILKMSGKVLLLAPVIKKRKGTYEDLFQNLFNKGYIRVRVDKEVRNLEEEIKLDKFKIHNIEVVIDRLEITKDSKEIIKRISDSVETSLNLSNGEIIVSKVDDKGKIIQDKLYSEHFSCPVCDISFEEIAPHTFSFNSPFGACMNCHGLGSIKKVDQKLIYNPSLSISEGGLYPISRMADNPDSWYMKILQKVAEKYKFSIRQPIGELSKKQLDIVLYGSGTEKFNVTFDRGNYFTRFEGIIPNIERRYKETESEYVRREFESYMRELPCEICEGKRLKKEALAVTIREKNINDIVSMSIKESQKWVNNLNKPLKGKDELSNEEKMIVERVIKEILYRMNFLISVGLDYLTLSRTAKTLSGGEAQRIRLASQIGTGLSGVLYVLDEPSIGLHQKDNYKLIETLKNLRDLGNTVIVVEHDEETINTADFIVDIGPNAGIHGGEVVATGKLEEIKKCKNSLTGDYLSGRKKIDKKEILKRVDRINNKSKFLNEEFSNGKNIEINGVTHHNLKNINVKIPLGKFVAITGVSGSGKSSLINETLYPALAHELYNSKIAVGNYSSISGIENIDKVVNIDQSPIGRTPRSNPATYTQVFTPIREIFAQMPEAKARGYNAGRFSFNVKRGRCQSCMGDGVKRIEMQFLPDVYVPCEVCKGQRYNRETLQIDFKGKNIAQVLDMTVEEALEFFQNVPNIKNKLDTLNEVGLGYIKLGQNAMTLSGGEAQRVKLANELAKRSTGKTIYILDEPTTGLHFYDIEKLLLILHSLVQKGNSVIVIEHNLDVIKTADHIIDLGPEGGEKGGFIIAQGSVEEIIKNEKSDTGKWLKKVIW